MLRSLSTGKVFANDVRMTPMFSIVLFLLLSSSTASAGLAFALLVLACSNLERAPERRLYLVPLITWFCASMIIVSGLLPYVARDFN